MTLAGLAQQNFGVREMALAMGRSASTISSELRRNAQPAGYASATARACTQQLRKQGRSPNKLHRCVFQPIVDAVSAPSWTIGVAHR